MCYTHLHPGLASFQHEVFNSNALFQEKLLSLVIGHLRFFILKFIAFAFSLFLDGLCKAQNLLLSLLCI